MFDSGEQGRMIYRSSVNGDEAGIDARGSSVEAGTQN
jgi:hypothetical protein